MSKVAKWNAVRAKLKVEFERKGITTCEMCGDGMYLGFAHRYKRRFITTDTELRICALLCVTCHQQLDEARGDDVHQRMFDTITELIARRENR